MRLLNTVVNNTYVKLAGNILYHTLDIAYNFLPTFAVLGRAGLKTSAEMATHILDEPLNSEQIKIISGIMFFSAALLAIGTKTIKHTTSCSEPQDRLYAAFSGPMMYYILDIASLFVHHAALFWTSTASVLGYAAYSAYYIIPDSYTAGDEPTPPLDPTYETIIETCNDNSYVKGLKYHAANAATGIRYSLFPMVVAWCIRRELSNKTVAPDALDYIITACVGVISVVAGIKYARDHDSKIFDYWAAISKACTMGALTYAGLSGVGANAITFNFSLLSEKALTGMFIPLASFVAGFAAWRTHVRKDEQFAINYATVNTVSNLPQTIETGLRSCFGCLFGCCRREQRPDEIPLNPVRAANNYNAIDTPLRVQQGIDDWLEQQEYQERASCRPSCCGAF